MKQEFYPTDMEDHVRIDKYLAEACPDLSRSYIQKLLKSGQVLVNGQGVKASYIVEEDDRIELEVPEAVEPEIDAEPMDLDILYEDQDLILINKPKGMVVHPAAGHYSHTLVNGLMYHCKDQLSGINGVMRPGIVHRLDRDVPGVMVFAKTREAAFLSAHLTAGKEYLALAEGAPCKEPEELYDLLFHDRARNKTYVVRRTRAGVREARLICTPLRLLPDGRAALHLQLLTGRTHQIRVQLGSRGCPVCGDRKYGAQSDGPLGLWSYQIAFFHPQTNERLVFAHDPPQAEPWLAFFDTLKEK